MVVDFPPRNVLIAGNRRPRSTEQLEWSAISPHEIYINCGKSSTTFDRTVGMVGDFPALGKNSVARAMQCRAATDICVRLTLVPSYDSSCRILLQMEREREREREREITQTLAAAHAPLVVHQQSTSRKPRCSDVVREGEEDV